MLAKEAAWNKVSESDLPQARQSYRSREKDSAGGFADGLKLFNPKKPDSSSEKKTKKAASPAQGLPVSSRLAQPG
jgi:hypothetical protein